MTMKALLGASLGLALALPAAASAQNAMGPGFQGQQNGAPPVAAQRLYHSLQQAGFRDIHIRPHSYLVHARDQDGNPVAMVVSPRAVTAVTALPDRGRDQGNAGNNNG